MWRRRRTGLLAAAGIALLGAAGCGSDDFVNDPRPAAPIELTAKIDDRKVVVSPTQIDDEPVGAGLATITIANLSDEDVSLTFDGPTERSTDPILPGGVTDFKLDLEEGDYTVAADSSDFAEAEFEVGPPRESAQNELLLP
jgi:hypothetical protein